MMPDDDSFSPPPHQLASHFCWPPMVAPEFTYVGLKIFTVGECVWLGVVVVGTCRQVIPWYLFSAATSLHLRVITGRIILLYLYLFWDL